MSFLLGLLAIGFGCVLVKYREQVGDMLGEPAWASKVGGIYIVVVILGVFMCFWGLATITGTSDIFLAPFTMFLPGVRR